MANAQLEAPRAVTWEMRLTTALPIPPWAVGALVSGGLLGLYLGARLLADIPFWEPDASGGTTIAGSARVSIVLTLLIGYTLAVNRYVVIATARDLQELGLLEITAGSRSMCRWARRWKRAQYCPASKA